MEPNNQQFSTIPPFNNSTTRRDTKWVSWLFIVIGIVVLGVMSFMIYQRNKTETIFTVNAIKQISEESNTLLSNAMLKFPVVENITDTIPIGTPADIKNLILEGALEQRYEVINYQGSKKGFYVRYTMSNSELKNLWVQISIKAATSSWISSGGNASDLFAFSDFKKDNPLSQVRVSLIQRNKNVDVIVQTLVDKSN